MLMRIEPSARVFTIDTGVLFPETYEVWRKVEDRYGLRVEVVDATPPNGTPWSASNCCGAPQGRRAGARACGRGRLDHRDPARAVADSGGRSGRRVGRGARRLEVQPARGVERQPTSGPTSTSTISPTIRFTTGATSRSVAPPARCPATAARAAGRARTRPSAACTYDTASMTISPAPPILRRDELELRDLTSAGPRVRGHPRDPRGRRGARARRAAVLGRQGQRRAAAPGAQGVPPRRACRSR